MTSPGSCWPSGASARSHSSRAVSPFLTKTHSWAAIAPASMRSARWYTVPPAIGSPSRMVHSTAAVPWQQRWVIADAAELCRGQRPLADAGVAMGCDDQIGTLGDLRRRDPLGIRLPRHLGTGGTGC